MFVTAIVKVEHPCCPEASFSMHVCKWDLIYLIYIRVVFVLCYSSTAETFKL